MNYIGVFSFMIATVVLPHLSLFTTAIIRGGKVENYLFFALVIRENHRCGGAIVALDVVITAANCLYNPEERRWASTEELRVLHGNFSNPDNWNGVVYGVQFFKYHTNYDPDFYGFPAAFDIALVKLTQQIAYNPLGRTKIAHCRQKVDCRFGVFIGMGITEQHPAKAAEQLMDTMLLSKKKSVVFLYILAFKPNKTKITT